MATYVAVVSLMQDLEQLLSSYDLILGSTNICPFEKGEIRILYNNVSLMDSLLRDSSGESYNHELIMSQTLEKRITDVTLTAGNYVDFWVYITCILYCHTTASLPFLTILYGLLEQVVESREEEEEEEPNLTRLYERLLELQKMFSAGDDENVKDLECTDSPGKLNSPSKLRASRYYMTYCARCWKR